MDWALLLILLICPLMMLFMHGGHNHGKHKSGHKHDHMNHNHENHNHSTVQEKSSSDIENNTDYKVKQLEGEVEFLKNQNETLQRKLVNITQEASQR